VAMDGRTLAEQAALVGNAECIVAAHGAALANLVFTPGDAQVVELRYRNWPNTMFADVATTLGLRYSSLFGTEPRLPRWLGRPHLIDADTVADVGALERLLDTLGIR
jgi:capsular polysaccharide biosynthesis protein